VSLINEALRKARQAAAEHESSRPDTAFRAPRAYPRRGPRRWGGVILLVLVAATAGLTGAVLVWWTLDAGRSSVVPADEPVTEAALETAKPSQPDSPAAHERSVVDPESATDPPAYEADDRGIRTEGPVKGKTAGAAPEPRGHEAAAAPSGPRQTHEEAPASEQPTSGERVFVLDADLGYAALSLGFIVARPVDPFAEINDIEVHIGSEVAGFVVEKIEPDQVVLRDERGELVLRAQ
jgi:hypothetical protein